MIGRAVDHRPDLGSMEVLPVVKFEPLQSAVDLTFWLALNELKLNTWRLSEEAVDIRGFWRSANPGNVPPFLQVQGQSFDAQPKLRQGDCSIPGTLRNFNTEAGFHAALKAGALAQAAAQVWQDILSGTAEQHPSVLSRFLVLSYADLKSFTYKFWFAFPALKPPQPFRTSTEARPVAEELGEAAAHQLSEACDAWRGRGGSSGQAAAAAAQAASQPYWLVERTVQGSFSMHPLSHWQQLQAAGTAAERWLAFADPGNNPSHPGWPLRNLLLLAAKRWGCQSVRALAVREINNRMDAQRSLLLSVQMPLLEPGWGEGPDGLPAVVGWEPNAHGQPGPRTTNLAPVMDPRRLADAAVDLNISLMRWRAAPELGVDRMATARCLLLGAGTLGCAVARTLLGWGVRGITFVDGGHVAYSNPVRQSLYEFEDCMAGGRFKAQAAAERLQRVLPSARAQGVVLNIPMPGHPLAGGAEIEKARQDVEQLEALVASHDVVFLLTDTRESRWLPTLLAAAHGCLAVNAALGFDSFLVMRHGAGPAGAGRDQAAGPSSSAKRLGCYFCNDVVAPQNSMLDRTLDQQCTVARPGLAGMAGSLAVELMAATLQHPLGMHAPASGQQAAAQADEAGLPLGAPAHMIRGQLSSFSQMCLTGEAFQQCTACSATVVSQYRSRGWDFILQALQDHTALEDLTGLTELHASMAALDVEGPASDDDAAGGSASGDDWTSL